MHGPMRCCSVLLFLLRTHVCHVFKGVLVEVVEPQHQRLKGWEVAKLSWELLAL